MSVGLRTEKLARNVAAWMCMVAVALLYAPLAGAAFLAHGIDCCAGRFCPIREHHHNTQKAAESQDAMPMDCDHEMNRHGHDVGGMMSCSMSCCQDVARPALIPGAFPLPGATTVPAVRETVRPIQFTQPREISRLSKPLSPPPRSGALAL